MSVFLREFLEGLLEPMAIVGVAGQALFSMRFIVQWLVSERRKESVVPVSFWYLSIIGGSLTLVYAIWRKEPLFTIAQASGLLVYARNLMLIHRRPKTDGGGPRTNKGEDQA
jgi:lipid-A-disaccharide synthase-like uncharacterized protein